VVVNLTESTHGERSFTLHPGEHPFIYKDSDVNFGDALATDLSRLRYAIEEGAATPQAPMSLEIVAAIIAEAKTHPAFPPILRRFLPT
jgi:hypothetical protein